MYTPPPTIEKVSKALRISLPGAREDLEESIRVLDVIRVELAHAIADHQKLLYEKRKQYLWPKDAEKGLTELDRTTRLNGDLAALEADWTLLNALNEILEQKITLALVLIK